MQQLGSTNVYYIIGRMSEGKLIPYLDGIVFDDYSLAVENFPK